MGNSDNAFESFELLAIEEETVMGSEQVYLCVDLTGSTDTYFPVGYVPLPPLSPHPHIPILPPPLSFSLSLLPTPYYPFDCSL